MTVFFENPLFFLADDTEPTFPIPSLPTYSDSEKRIVELTDVGCDTEATYPIYFSRGNWHRGKAKSFGLSRKIIKCHHEKLPKYFSYAATILNDLEDRNENYIRSKSQRDNQVYNRSSIKHTDPDNNFSQNMTEHFWKERPLQDVCYSHKNYSRYLEIPSLRNNYAFRENDDCAYHQRENAHPQQLADSGERNIYKTRNTDVRLKQSLSNEREKRIKSISRRDDFNYEKISGEDYAVLNQEERENAFLSPTDIVTFTKNHDCDRASLENVLHYQESTSSLRKMINDHGRLQKIMPQEKELYNFDSKWAHLDTTDSEKDEFPEIRKKSNFRNLSSKSTINENTKYPILVKDMTTENLKIPQSNLFNKKFPRIRSAMVSTEQQSINVHRARKELHSVIDKRKIDNSLTPAERNVNSSSIRTKIDDPRYSTKSDVTSIKVFNESANETAWPAKFCQSVANSRNNKRTYVTNEKNNTNFQTKSFENDKLDQANLVNLSQSAKDVAANGQTFNLKITTASLRTEEKEKKKKNVSKLPVRTWKRIRTKKPAALRLQNNVMSEAIGQKLQDTDTFETMHFSNVRRRKNDEDHEKIMKDRVNKNCNGRKQNDCYKTRSFDTNKSKLADLKYIKGVRSLNTTKKIREQRSNKAS